MESKSNLAKNYQEVIDDINKAKAQAKIEKDVRLIAVSKQRTVEQIQEIYNAGQRNFGENYLDQILEKSPKLPKDIQWYFIGHLQGNKVKKLLDAVPNVIIESVDSEKLAENLNKTCSKLGINELRVYVEINIGNTETKTGASLNDIDNIVKTIIEKCDKLKLVGIMSLGNVHNKEEFAKMLEIKDSFCQKYNLDKKTFIASFGTSDDYVDAIESGSDEVRVGHKLFK